MNLQTMEEIVLEVLEKSPLARADDYVLMWLVCLKLKPEITEKPFSDVMYHHNTLGLPNWESVTRCRRKIQQNRTDLISQDTARRRRKKEKEYNEYAKM